MSVSSRNRPRHRRKHQAPPTDHANFNEFLGRHKPEAGGFCLYLSQLYVGCQAKEPQKLRFGEWDAHGKTTREILHVVQNDGLGGATTEILHVAQNDGVGGDRALWVYGLAAR